jgi:hypothetical protein
MPLFGETSICRLLQDGWIEHRANDRTGVQKVLLSSQLLPGINSQNVPQMIVVKVAAALEGAT